MAYADPVMQLEAQRRWYRRAKQWNKFFTLRLEQDTYEDLKRMAKRRNCPITELIRTYIVWGLEEDA